MTEIDPQLASALARQLDHRRTLLLEGAERVGWKLGLGTRERIGDGPVIGHLTSATRLEPGASYRPVGAAALHADAEVALELGRDVEPDADARAARAAIAGFAPALELVALGGAPDDPEAIVAHNVFHRAFALGRPRASMPVDGIEARIAVDGDVRAAARSPVDFADRVCAAARLLGAVGELLQAGDRLITGSIVQVPVQPGEEVVADLGALGRLRLRIAHV